MKDPRFFTPARYEDTPGEPITHFDVVPATEGVLADAGAFIAWPNGERWAHISDQLNLTYTTHGAPVWAPSPNDTQEAA